MIQACPSFAWQRLLPQRRAHGTLCALLVATLAHPGHADDAENVAAARSLGIQGVQLADAGKCPEAIEKLQRAETLHHAPTILGRLGECQVTVGQVVEGTENLNRVVREPLSASAPKVFHDAQDRAQKVLTAATPKIAHLLIRVVPTDVTVSVTVAGRAVPAALLGAERPTDPGTHTITATAAGYKPASATVTLTEASHEEMTLTLERDPNAVAALPGATQPPVTGIATPPEPAAKKSHTAAYLAFGVGAAGLVAGGVTGALAFGKASNCTNKVCPKQSDLDGARSMATISTIGFGVGIAGIAVGTILLLTGNEREAPQAQAKAYARPTLSMEPWLGVSTLGVSGSFQ